MILAATQKEILSLEPVGLTATNLSPNHSSIPIYYDLKRIGLVRLVETEESNIMAACLTPLGRKVQKQILRQ